MTSRGLGSELDVVNGGLHEFGGQLRVPFRKLETDGPPVLLRQRMTQLVPDVAVVALLDRGAHEVGVEIFRLETAVRTPHVADHAAVGANSVLAAEVREHLERADFADRLLHAGDTL